MDVTIGDYCIGGAIATIDWDVSGTQTAYQVQVDTDAGFAAPITYDSGQINSGSTIFTTPAGVLSFNATYRARVRAFNGATPSAWVVMSSCDDPEAGVNRCNGGSSWDTPPHAYPSVNFTWLPSQPTANSPITFTDSTTFAPGSINRTWNWTFPTGSPGSGNTQGPHSVTFNSSGIKNVTLDAGDDAGSCSRTLPVNVGIALPTWREVAPR